jgi:hypothetical protein
MDESSVDIQLFILSYKLGRWMIGMDSIYGTIELHLANMAPFHAIVFPFDGTIHNS